LNWQLIRLALGYLAKVDLALGKFALKYFALVLCHLQFSSFLNYNCFWRIYFFASLPNIVVLSVPKIERSNPPEPNIKFLCK
jgi:hypothetical protein